MTDAPRTFWRAGGALTHPVALLAVALLAWNDHFLKGVGPAWLTGKLSDFAGLAFFPLLLEAFVEGARALAGRFAGPSRRVGFGAVVLTAVGFAWVKLAASGGAAYSAVLVFVRAPYHLVTGQAADRLRPSTLQDPTDLVALLALAIPIAIVLRRTRDPAPHRVA